MATLTHAEMVEQGAAGLVTWWTFDPWSWRFTCPLELESGRGIARFEVLDVDWQQRAVTFDVHVRAESGPGLIEGTATAVFSASRIGCQLELRAELRRYHVSTLSGLGILEALARGVRTARRLSFPERVHRIRADLGEHLLSVDSGRRLAMGGTLVLVVGIVVAGTRRLRRSVSR